MNIRIVYATTNKTTEILLEVVESCSVEKAILQSGILDQHPEIDINHISVGVYSKKVNLETLLNDGDRVEIYRPLKIDPKQARLIRAHKK